MSQTNNQTQTNNKTQTVQKTVYLGGAECVLSYTVVVPTPAPRTKSAFKYGRYKKNAFTTERDAFSAVGDDFCDMCGCYDNSTGHTHSDNDYDAFSVCGQCVKKNMK